MSYGYSRRTFSPNITETLSITDTPILIPAEVGAWLRLSAGMITKESAIIQNLIDTVIPVVEKYTWLNLRRKSLRAQYDLGHDYFFGFLNGKYRLNLERSPILSASDIGDIEYLNDSGVYVTFDKGTLSVDGLYENVTEKMEQRQWASVFFRESVPFDNERVNAYKIRITFDSGFTTPGDPPPPAANPITDVPQAIKTAMLMIIADYYTNRGDCSACGCDLGGFPVPCSAKSILDQWSIAGTITGGEYNPADGYDSAYRGLC